MTFEEIVAELEKEARVKERDQSQFWDWLKMGMERKWVTEPYCGTHSGPDLTAWEAQKFARGEQPCVVSVRVLWLSDGPVA